MNRYFVYGRPDCPFCVKALEHLSNAKCEYLFIDVSGDADFERHAKDFYGHPTVPMILSNDKNSGRCVFIGGSDALEGHLKDGT